jgi:putative transcription factor
MRCEVCGRKIHENPNRVVIEGAKMTVCHECAKHGKGTWEPAPQVRFEPAHPTAPGITHAPAPIQIRKKDFRARVDTSTEVVEGYGEIVRQARERLGYTTEDLGKKINEHESVLRKIELQKLAPNSLLVSKLERTLKITLMVPVEEEKTAAPALPKGANRELTLGDLIKAEKEKGE